MREGGFCVGRQALFDEATQSGDNLRGLLSGDKTEGEFGGGLRRDHRLGAGSAIAADDAVDLGGRPRPELLENAEALLACRLAQADAAEKPACIEAERAPGRELGGRGGANVIVETWDGDAAVFVMQRRQEL